MCWWNEAPNENFLLLLTKNLYYPYQLLSLLTQPVPKQLVPPVTLHFIGVVLSSDKDSTLGFICMKIKEISSLWRKRRISRELEKYKI